MGRHGGRAHFACSAPSRVERCAPRPWRAQRGALLVVLSLHGVLPTRSFKPVSPRRVLAVPPARSADPPCCLTRTRMADAAKPCRLRQRRVALTKPNFSALSERERRTSFESRQAALGLRSCPLSATPVSRTPMPEARGLVVSPEGAIPAFAQNPWRSTRECSQCSASKISASRSPFARSDCF